MNSTENMLRAAYKRHDAEVGKLHAIIGDLHVQLKDGKDREKDRQEHMEACAERHGKFIDELELRLEGAKAWVEKHTEFNGEEVINSSPAQVADEAEYFLVQKDA